ncbi:MAG: YXWGXW repeat-containing protein [Pseudomonadota bacterium]
MFKKILMAGMVAATLAGASLSVMAQQRTIIITQQPPAARAEAVPAPRDGYEWAPGYWSYRNNDYAWVPGRWNQARRGQVWVPEKWVEKKTWVLEAGHWERRQRGGGDRDGDGIRNRNDRDRDGDGVRNRNDAQPNNPNRN